MLLVTTDYIAGKELEMLGMVKGSTIQTKHLGKDITQSFKTLVGGELTAYTEMMNDARALATKRMVQEARERGVLIDASFGRRTRAVLVMDNDHLVLSALQPETVANRIAGQDTAAEEEEEEAE